MTRNDESRVGGASVGVTLPHRSREYGVGKEMRGAVYVHRDYEGVFGLKLERARRRLPSDFEYTVVKLDQATAAFSFIQVADFDSAAEPTVGATVTVKQDGSARAIPPSGNPFIYHHKWLFVEDDYSGFDVDESKRRSLAWMSLPDIDKARIGRKDYWESEVVPRLDG